MTRSRRKTLDGLRRVRDVEARAAKNALLIRQAEVLALEAQRNTVQHLQRESEELGGALGDGLARGLGTHLHRIEQRRVSAETLREQAREGWRGADTRLRAVDTWLERVRVQEQRTARRHEQLTLEELARVGRVMKARGERGCRQESNHGGLPCRSA